ncbi:uricase-like [Teleopsis dalmanni]|uniref:uricase-like n=1 Tax=Teleopsis dalmanni TaxID=139649 RepID=UPI0018CD378C|nr:uricase-like [Teleopsis dalmanni]
MFTRPLYNAQPSQATKILDPAAPNYRMGDYGYGKEDARVFQVKKNGPIHSILEYKVSAYMRLGSHKEYYEANNCDIIGSDVAETTIYMHARKYGLKTPEEFALSLTKHFLDTYNIIAESNVVVEDLQWDRLGTKESEGYYKDAAHNHVFTRNCNEKRYCEVVRKRGEDKPLLIGGISDLRVIKTAKSSFVGYVKGDLFTEGDMPERILCTDLNARWQYATIDNIDFTKHWYKVREILLKSFAGHPVDGFSTTSVQFIAYTAERNILDAMPEICSVMITLPNYPHLQYDFSRFPSFESEVDVIISNPRDLPRSVGYAHLDRLKLNEN